MDVLELKKKAEIFEKQLNELMESFVKEMEKESLIVSIGAANFDGEDTPSGKKEFAKIYINLSIH